MGGFTTTWTTEVTVWAAVWPQSASEAMKADSASMTTRHRIRIRYFSSVSPTWRVECRGTYYNVVSVVNPNKANRWLDLICEEVSA